MCKPLLPTHIEFAILDTFDNLEELARAAAIASAVKVRSAASAVKVCASLRDAMLYCFVWCWLVMCRAVSCGVLSNRVIQSDAQQEIRWMGAVCDVFLGNMYELLS